METSKISPNVSNLAMPRGRVSFAPLNSSGAMTGEVDLGNCLTFDLTNKIGYKDHKTSHDTVVVLDAKKPTEQLWDLKIKMDELSAEAVALFFLQSPDAMKGTSPSVQSQTGATVSNQAATCYLDRWIDLGKKFIKTGSITVNQTSPSLSFSCALTVSGEDTNCRVDYENGLIMIKTASGFTDASACTISFKYGTMSLKMFVPTTQPMIGFLRYRGLSANGPRYSIECWKVQITPDAALPLIKPEDYVDLGFSGDVYIDDDTNAHQAVNPFFRVTELGAATAYPS
jgi:hypothetical protein